MAIHEPSPRQFKVETVKLVTERSLPRAQVAYEMGSWIKEFEIDGEQAFPGQGYPRDKELVRPCRENEQLRQEREILSHGCIEERASSRMTEAGLVVQDDRPGFPRQVLEQVGPDYTTKLDGHRLGLVAVIANVQWLGGSVELENRSGAVVTIKLPLVRE